MTLTHVQELMIGKFLDDQFKEKYSWGVGPQNFSRLCDTRRDYLMPALAMTIQANLDLTVAGDLRGVEKPIDVLVYQAATTYDLGASRHCQGCRGRMSIIPEDHNWQPVQFCALAMIALLRDQGGVSVDRMRDVLRQAKPVGRQNADYDQIQSCRHGYGKICSR